MQRVKLRKKNILITILLSSIVFFAVQKYRSYSLQKKGETRVQKPNSGLKITNAYNAVAPGDVVFRRGADGISDLFVSMNQTNKSYSHCGICLLDSGIKFIYHSIGGEDNPTKFIQKDSFQHFISPTENLGFAIIRFPFSAQQKNNVDSIAKQWYLQKRTFDMDFDLHNSDTQLYCVEYVAKAIQLAIKDSTYFTKSYIPVKKYLYYAPDNILLQPNATIILENKY